MATFTAPKAEAACVVKDTLKVYVTVKADKSADLATEVAKCEDATLYKAADNGDAAFFAAANYGAFVQGCNEITKDAKYGWLDCQEGSMKWTTGYTDAKCTLPATGRVEDADWTLTLDKAKEGKGECVAAVGKDIGWKASYTAAGWTAAAANNSSDANNTSNNSSNATGAKSLAAAVAAGALAVVATQF